MKFKKYRDVFSVIRAQNCGSTRYIKKSLMSFSENVKYTKILFLISKSSLTKNSNNLTIVFTTHWRLFGNSSYTFLSPSWFFALFIQSPTARKVSKYKAFSDPYFAAFGPEKTPYLDTFHAVFFVPSRKFYIRFDLVGVLCLIWISLVPCSY